MKIPYGICRTNSKTCPSLEVIGKIPCGKENYWECKYFVRAGWAEVQSDYLDKLPHYTKELLEKTAQKRLIKIKT